MCSSTAPQSSTQASKPTSKDYFSASTNSNLKLCSLTSKSFTASCRPSLGSVASQSSSAYTSLGSASTQTSSTPPGLGSISCGATSSHSVSSLSQCFSSTLPSLCSVSPQSSNAQKSSFSTSECIHLLWVLYCMQAPCGDFIKEAFQQIFSTSIP